MGKDEVDRILDAAVQAQKAWARVPIAERAVPMRKVAALLRERAPELGRLAALEMGKPLKDGAAEATKCAWVCEYYAENAEAFLAPRPETSDGSQAYVRFDPLGVILAVMPWNFPYWQVFRFIAPHLMAGNGGLLKHASNVPQCALAIEKLMHDAGFPPDLFRTLLVGSKPVRGIILDPRIAAATITGSEPAGRAVAAAAGEALEALGHGAGRLRPVHRARRRRPRPGRQGGRGGPHHQRRAELHLRQALHRRGAGVRRLPREVHRGHEGGEGGRPHAAGHRHRAAGAHRPARRDARAGEAGHRRGGAPGDGLHRAGRAGRLLPGLDPGRREDQQRGGPGGALRAGGGGDPRRLGRPRGGDRQRLAVRAGRLALDPERGHRSSGSCRASRPAPSS